MAHPSQTQVNNPKKLFYLLKLFVYTGNIRTFSFENKLLETRKSKSTNYKPVI